MSGIRIFVIEDNVGDLVLIREMMKDSGLEFEMESSQTLKEGLKTFKELDYDILLLDLGLPDSDGIETFLKAQAELSDKTIIILTGLSDEEQGTMAVSKGAQDYLIKGQIDANLLSRSVRYSLERKKAEKEIKASLEQKELLLREIHHRVKNNLQIISSLLNLQSLHITDEKILDHFKDTQNRIKSISLVHEKLYQSEDIAQIDILNYIQHLVDDLVRNYGRQDIHISLDVESIQVDTDTAIPCGLIINELISNSIKHAFPDNKGGEIQISLKKSPSGEFELIISDNGVGISPELDLRKLDTLGLELVHSLVNQLDGTINIQRSPGTSVTIKFKAMEYTNRI
jgi:two-component sensor histidine kinase